MATQLTPPPTATVVAYPSKLLPGIPAFVFAVPPGWALDEASGALAVIRPLAEVNGFWINAILSHAKVARSVGFREVSTTTWKRLLDRLPDATVITQKFIEINGQPMFLRSSEMTSEAGRAISQLHAIFFGPAHGEGKVIDVFQIVCTVPRENADDYGATMFDFIRSFKFV